VVVDSEENPCKKGERVTDDQVERLVAAAAEHGNQLGGNLVALKHFLNAQRDKQQAFLAEQRTASDKAQQKAYRAAFWSAVAAGAAALAGIAQVVVAIIKP
jgi:hypothetical protein